MQEPALRLFYRPILDVVREIVSRSEFDNEILSLDDMCYNHDPNVHIGECWRKARAHVQSTPLLQHALPIIFAISADEMISALDPLTGDQKVGNLASLFYNALRVWLLNSCFRFMFAS